MKNQVIQILIPGEANGIKVLNLAGWSGLVFVIPRNSLKEIKSRPEINQPGVYFLFGSNEESTKENVYIGESESFFNRLENHDANKDFWNTAIVFTGSLDRADVKFLENKSTRLAKEVGRYEVLNIVQPQENQLSEFKKVAAQDFFEKIEYIMAVLSFPLFSSIKESITDTSLYQLKVENVIAKGKMLNDGNFLVLKGSQARIRETTSFSGWSYGARREFLQNGKLLEDKKNNAYIFTEDILFTSPSAAASTVAGRAMSGWIVWRDQNGKTLDENIRK